MIGRPPKPLAERFLAMFEIGHPDECWPWLGSGRADGYGIITDGSVQLDQQGRNKGGKPLRVHRVSYEHFVGPIPEGFTVDHVCHNSDPVCTGGKDCPHRRCVNPAHLEVVTLGENVRRGKARNMLIHRSGRCSRGHEMVGENVRQRKDGTRRECRTCANAASRAWYHRRGLSLMPGIPSEFATREAA
jgi:hypothetical protein